MAQQAQALLKGHVALSSRHEAKAALDVKGSRTTGKIHSLRTLEKYANSLKLAGEWAQQETGLKHLKEISTDTAQAYLEYRAASGIGQKQLDADRNALGFILDRNTLERVHAVSTPALQARAYTAEQVHVIASRQSDRHRLATEIAHQAGLRAHELFTLRRADEGQASTHRQWHPDRFNGREGYRYIVTGKGGLHREVLLPTSLAERLEKVRLSAPKTVSDRGIHYTQRYNIAAGESWSKRFSEMSKRALGWSTGAHGLRHSYAQERMGELQGLGQPYYRAREIVSQELGHFRGDVVETYLR